MPIFNKKTWDLSSSPKIPNMTENNFDDFLTNFENFLGCVTPLEIAHFFKFAAQLRLGPHMLRPVGPH